MTEEEIAEAEAAAAAMPGKELLPTENPMDGVEAVTKEDLENATGLKVPTEKATVSNTRVFDDSVNRYKAVDH